MQLLLLVSVLLPQWQQGKDKRHVQHCCNYYSVGIWEIWIVTKLKNVSFDESRSQHVEKHYGGTDWKNRKCLFQKGKAQKVVYNSLKMRCLSPFSKTRDILKTTKIAWSLFVCATTCWVVLLSYTNRVALFQPLFGLRNYTFTLVYQ